VVKLPRLALPAEILPVTANAVSVPTLVTFGTLTALAVTGNISAGNANLGNLTSNS
jgi:hypothetical protein